MVASKRFSAYACLLVQTRRQALSNSLVFGLLQGSHDMQVGDVLQVVKDSFFPADLLLLAVPESPDGLAYVETINLDGESNLKIKKALDQTQHIRLETMQHFMVTFWACIPGRGMAASLALPSILVVASPIDDKLN